LPRLLKKPFEAIPDAPAMLKAFPTWPDQDHNPAFKACGICATTSLVALDPEATPTQFFLQGGYGASSVDIKVLEKLLMDCGAGIRSRSAVPTLAKKVLELARQHGLPQAVGKGNMGHLLQVFVHRTCVDRCAYASHPLGAPDPTRQPLSQALTVSDEEIVGQVRITANPSAFMRASKVRLFAASADKTFHYNRSQFQQEVVELLDPILGRSDVREKAVKGIYNGKLPSWWRDLAAEAEDAAES